MEPGICPHCRSHGSRYFEHDPDAGGSRLTCWTCGHTSCWKTQDGDIYEPPPRCPDYKLDNHPARMSKGG